MIQIVQLLLDAWCWLSVTRYRIAELNKAESALTESLQLHGGNEPICQFFLSMIRYKLGQVDLARELYGQAEKAVAGSRHTAHLLRQVQEEARRVLESATK